MLSRGLLKFRKQLGTKLRGGSPSVDRALVISNDRGRCVGCRENKSFLREKKTALKFRSLPGGRRSKPTLDGERDGRDGCNANVQTTFERLPHWQTQTLDCENHTTTVFNTNPQPIRYIFVIIDPHTRNTDPLLR